MVYDFIRGPGKNAEDPGEINNRGARANFVHVEDSSKQTLTGASNIRKRVGGAGSFKAVLNFVGRTNLVLDGSKKDPPGFTIG